MGVQSVGIPVEISEDSNTVTLKAITIKPEDKEIQLYPTMVFDNQGQLAFYNPYVVSEVVLTKGWNGGATPAPAKASSSKNLYGKKVANGELFKTPAKVYSRTAFAPATKKVEKTTVANIKFPTKEEIKKNLDKMMQKYNRTLR